MPTYGIAEHEVSMLENEWSQLDSDFADFVTARSIDGTWKQLEQGRLKPDIPPELIDYVQGAYSMFGGLADDFRNYISIKSMNPTRFSVYAAGVTEQAKKIESNWKLAWSSWWTQDINRGRWLDSYHYEGQGALGIAAIWLRWRKMEKKDAGVCGCPVYAEKVLAECIRWKGNFRNPSAAWIRYSVSAVDCDIKNGKGERPSYDDAGNLGWVSEGLPYDYKANSGKQIDVIVRDAEDPMAMCPLGCYNHRKRRITIYICKKDGKPSDYEEVESYDSPFERCSFVITGGDVREHERDPHRILRPSQWVLYQIVMELNRDRTMLMAMTRRELADETSYLDAGSSNQETVSALTMDAEGGNKPTVQRPESTSRDFPVLPGAIRKFPGPTLEGLRAQIEYNERQYALRRPNPALMGQMQLSEVAATVGQLQVQGAGISVSTDLANYDSTQVRIIEEIRHGIRFTSHFEPDGAKTKYMAMVTGKEHVYGKRGAAAGETVYIDAKMCEHDVIFEAITSKDTPSEKQQRVNQALTLFHEGVYVMEDVDEAVDIYDHETQNEKRAGAEIDDLLKPLRGRLLAAVAIGRASAETGMDFGSLLDPATIEVEGADQGQTRNTSAANAAMTVAPTVTPAPTGTPTGGSSGLA